MICLQRLWAMPWVTAPIVGATKLQHLEDALAQRPEAGAVGPARLPRLQICPWSPADPRLDLERAHPAVSQGPNGK